MAVFLYNAAWLTSWALTTSWILIGGIALLFTLLFLLGGLIGPMPRYVLSNPDAVLHNESDAFVDVLESLTDAKVNRKGTVDVMANGPIFYSAMLTEMRSAQQSICLEAYIFQKSEIAKLYVEVMTERARAGVQVSVIVDAFGSFSVRHDFFEPLLEAGGRVERYNGLHWYSLSRLNNRTHRELLIVDGRVGFIGGAGVADEWFKGVGSASRWRDTVVRVQGEAVPNLVSTFAENWLTSHGELLMGPRYFPEIQCPDNTLAMVINSTPTPGGSTRARVLFQMLLASAQRAISITTPYFLPDHGLVQELCKAVARGVTVTILVPGRAADHMMTRSTSRGGYGPLLRAGAEVYEYQPAMIHAKILIVDELWAVVGSTNFDNRSFGINDEVNLAVRDKTLAARLQCDMTQDLAMSRHIGLAEWNQRAFVERGLEVLGWIFERQQ